MKKIIRILSIFLCSLLLTFAGCFDSYTDEELSAMEAKFASFDNNKNFALDYFSYIQFIEKDIDIYDLEYEGKPIDGLFGFGDKYFYLATSTRETKFSNETITFLKTDYDTLEMEEIGQIKNFKDVDSYGRYADGKLYFIGDGNYYTYDIATGQQERLLCDHEEFWQGEAGQYSFEIKDEKNDSVMHITDNETGEIKQVSWKNDLSKFEEGRYIQSFDNRFKSVKSAFVSHAEKDGVCYLVGWIPLTNVCFHYRAVIFTYDFETETLSYYSSTIYHDYNPPDLTIIER